MVYIGVIYVICIFISAVLLYVIKAKKDVKNGIEHSTKSDMCGIIFGAVFWPITGFGCFINFLLTIMEKYIEYLIDAIYKIHIQIYSYLRKKMHKD
jgi:hypothetical protein